VGASIKNVSFVISVNDDGVLNNNFLASPMFNDKGREIDIVLIKNSRSAALAYNEGANKAKNDLMIFCHQDVVFPANWLKWLDDEIAKLEQFDKDWGVLGCIGCNKQGIMVGNIYCNANGQQGKGSEKPEKIQTLDELLLIFKKSSNLRFDDTMPYFHFYGTDITITAKAIGKSSYVINAPCFHNTSKIIVLPKNFLFCYKYILKKWKEHLPIYTTCAIVSYWYLFEMHYELTKDYFRTKLFGIKSKKRLTDRNEIAKIVSAMNPRPL